MTYATVYDYQKIVPSKERQLIDRTLNKIHRLNVKKGALKKKLKTLDAELNAYNDEQGAVFIDLSYHTKLIPLFKQFIRCAVEAQPSVLLLKKQIATYIRFWLYIDAYDHGFNAEGVLKTLNTDPVLGVKVLLLALRNSCDVVSSDVIRSYLLCNLHEIVYYALAWDASEDYFKSIVSNPHLPFELQLERKDDEFYGDQVLRVLKGYSEAIGLGIGKELGTLIAEL